MSALDAFLYGIDPEGLAIFASLLIGVFIACAWYEVISKGVTGIRALVGAIGLLSLFIGMGLLYWLVDIRPKLVGG